MQRFNQEYFQQLKLPSRYVSHPVQIGHVTVGGEQPVLVQSMTNTDTNDIDATVGQAMALFDEGCGMVRVAVQGRKELRALEKIKSRLTRSGYDQPLAADIHFLPEVALEAAGIVEKVRINPGNYAEKSRASSRAYDPGQYEIDLAASAERILPLIEQCKRHGTALRIGVNQGSLSARVMDRYGDTPAGMVVSAMEFLMFLAAQDFSNVVVSLKSSHVATMIRANRLLVAAMWKEKLACPVHLGVTEAGSDDEGKVRSALGIGTLMAEGIGDTIRVSLTGDPLPEIPFARKLTDIFGNRGTQNGREIIPYLKHTFDTPSRKEIHLEGLAREQFPLIASDEPASDPRNVPDLVHRGAGKMESQPSLKMFRINESPDPNTDIRVVESGQASGYAGFLQRCTKHEAGLHLLSKEYTTDDFESLMIRASVDIGAPLLDGCGDGLWLKSNHFPGDRLVKLSFTILQAAGLRISKADFIACPSCGRTRFDIAARLAQVKERFSHLTGIRIAVMGCIVNGPGEMAGADYGYIGSGSGKVTLYHKERPVLKNIGEERALEALETMIRDQGDWVEP